MSNINIEDLQNALDDSKIRLKNSEKEYEIAVVEQYKDCLNKKIQMEKTNIAVLEEKIKEIRKDEVNKIEERLDEYELKREKEMYDGKIHVSFNNFEYGSLLLFDLLHRENIAILYSLIKEEEANRLREDWENNINRIFKEYFALNRDRF